MWGVSGFGSEAFGHVRIDVVGAAPPSPSSPVVVAHLAGIEQAFAVVGRDVVVAVVGREPAALTFNMVQVST